MADQAMHQAPTISSTFPNPPDFLWRDFTQDKISRFEELRRTWQEEQPLDTLSKDGTIFIHNPPEDLKHLQPPPEPTEGSWRLHGDLFTVSCDRTYPYLFLQDHDRTDLSRTSALVER